MVVEDLCDGGRLVDSVIQVELVVMECVIVEIEERVLEYIDLVVSEVVVRELLSFFVEQ